MRSVADNSQFRVVLGSEVLQKKKACLQVARQQSDALRPKSLKTQTIVLFVTTAHLARCKSVASWSIHCVHVHCGRTDNITKHFDRDDKPIKLVFNQWGVWGRLMLNSWGVNTAAGPSVLQPGLT